MKPIASPRFSKQNTCSTPGRADSSLVRSAHASTIRRTRPSVSEANEAWWSAVKSGDWDAYYQRQYGERLAASTEA